MESIHKFVRYLRKEDSYRLVVVLLMVLHAMIISPMFLPSLNQIGVWDEATYINEGRELIGGKMIWLTGNPAIAAIYALTYLPVHAATHWLVYSCWLGRIILFVLLWLATFCVAGEVTRLSRFASPFIIFSLLLISPVATYLLGNGSDSLFAAMSSFALWQFLAFQRTRQLSHLWLCSLFLGFAELSRNEGTVLFAIMFCLAMIICLINRILIKGLIASVVPFAAVVLGFLLLYAVCTGRFETGSSVRSYIAFEQGHATALAGQLAVDGQMDARRIFGTAEENNNSVLRAIRRNPGAYVKRIIPLAKIGAQDVFAAYGWYLALFAMLFAVRGALDLVVRRKFLILATFVFWPAYCVLYTLLIGQRSHWAMSFLCVFGLVAVGVSAFVENLTNRRERFIWSGVVLLFILAALSRRVLPNGPAAVMCAFLAGLWIIWIVADWLRGDNRAPTIACLILLVLATVIGPGIRQSEAHVIGTAPDERAVVYLRQTFPAGTNVGGWGPGKLWDAKMEPVPMVLELRYIKTKEDLFDWMDRKKVQAIFVDDYLRNYEPGLWDTIQKQIGNGLTVGFDSGQGAVQVLVRTPGS